MSDKLKSAYELAMERLRAQGMEEPKSLTRKQKQAIAELRQQAKAKKAELQILRQQQSATAQGDPEKLQQEEERYQTDLRRIDSWLEEKIAEVKRG